MIYWLLNLYDMSFTYTLLLINITLNNGVNSRDTVLNVNLGTIFWLLYYNWSWCSFFSFKNWQINIIDPHTTNNYCSFFFFLLFCIIYIFCHFLIITPIVLNYFPHFCTTVAASSLNVMIHKFIVIQNKNKIKSCQL